MDRRVNGKLHHILFLPAFIDGREGLIFNFLTIVVFLAVYLWHTHHDHKHNEELLDEVKKIREEIEKQKR